MRVLTVDQTAGARRHCPGRCFESRTRFRDASRRIAFTAPLNLNAAVAFYRDRKRCMSSVFTHLFV
ncbi:hypothetical protein WM40_02230 [Robbsia andropogonis]|uniref:Uncharacterized protein n=1 Tax=Robbsia andropogonis TaxID=28092 RepID=A0A0F5K4P8_9BURK|nr:hypothetical protein WM40_02230 [Robbsia andropogonis]